MPFTASDICKIILAIILPPVGVFLERGCGADFFINILLTILAFTNMHRLPARYHPRSVHHPEVLSVPSLRSSRSRTTYINERYDDFKQATAA
ncbi:Plasma membrane proteolipid 3 [Colletotrichum gloeosporioides]|uniref:Plasma membrane proteolipid 3 n=1 Tax=Colletotrichum gloeosporioides TaxID=474922 RepID=A0A8H4CSN5_COLGL|nr:Plasma membrane proteolipid 3 [Colletotrichum gloeosporioides]KAF3809294.1 Plasma membrane proteolipid 3 [Colletotrichum gloeosporioides]